MESSPACWAAYGQVLAREYSDIRFARCHQLTVDAYAVQHPGRPSAQSIQSVGLHLMSLCLAFEHAAGTTEIRIVLQASKEFKKKLIWLEPPPKRGEITIADILSVTSARAHARQVRVWAESAWKAWSPHHDTIRQWTKEFALKH